MSRTATLDGHLVADLGAARSAWQYFEAAQQEFQLCCGRGDWKAAEEARARALASIDSYMDNLATAYKRLETN